MKIISNKENLSFVVQLVQRAVSPKSPLPILSGIKFATGNECLIVTATDLEIGIRCITPAEILEHGAAVLPARYITELIKRLPEVPIFLESDPLTGSAKIKYGQSEAVINGFAVDEFPDFPIPAGEATFALKEDTLKEAIKQVVFAASTEESRPVFTGVSFKVKDGELEMTATDTHRLAWRKLQLEDAADIDINLVIPGKTLNELTRVIGNPEQNVQVTVTENQVLFTTNDMSLISRLINGKFPDYKHVVPQEHISRIRLRTRDLMDASDRASLLTKEGSQVIKLLVRENNLIINVNTEAGRIHEEVSVYQEGESLQAAFNARYLSDILKVVGSDEISIEFNGPYSPAMVRPAGKEDYFSLLLPVRYREE